MRKFFLTGLFLLWVYIGSFFRKIWKNKFQVLSEPDLLKNVRSICYAVFKCYDKLIKDFCLLFSLMLYNFFRIKSPSLFFVCLLLFFCFSFTADGVTVFCNMAEDESLFTGRGDYQFDVYRLMKKANKYVLFNCTSSSKKIVVFTL